MVIPFQAIEVYLDNVVPIDSKSSSVDALASPSNTDRQIVVSSYIDSFEEREELVRRFHERLAYYADQSGLHLFGINRRWHLDQEDFNDESIEAVKAIIYGSTFKAMVTGYHYDNTPFIQLSRRNDFVSSEDDWDRGGSTFVVAFFFSSNVWWTSISKNWSISINQHRSATEPLRIFHRRWISRSNPYRMSRHYRRRRIRIVEPFSSVSFFVSYRYLYVCSTHRFGSLRNEEENGTWLLRVLSSRYLSLSFPFFCVVDDLFFCYLADATKRCVSYSYSSSSLLSHKAVCVSLSDSFF